LAQTSGGNTIILRLEIDPEVPFIQIANAIHESKNEIVAVDTVNKSKTAIIRDITVTVPNMKRKC
jgi:malate dehydrogenase (oxaloacetate-decarboxylating)